MTNFKTLLLLATSFVTLTVVRAQFDFLPPCGQACAEKTATAVGCGAQDIACACAKPAFLDPAIDCGYETCPYEDRSPTEYRLSDACADLANNPPPPTNPVSSSNPPAAPPASSSAPPVVVRPSSTVPQASPAPTANTNRPTDPAQHNTATQNTPNTPNTPNTSDSPAPSGFIRNPSSSSAESTVVVVKTVGPGGEEDGGNQIIDDSGVRGGLNVQWSALVGAVVVAAGLLA